MARNLLSHTRVSFSSTLIERLRRNRLQRAIRRRRAGGSNDELFKQTAALDLDDPSARAELERLSAEAWEQVPIEVRDEIEKLVTAGWRRNAFGAPTDPEDEETWAYIHPGTYEKTLSSKRARRLEGEAGRGWWNEERQSR